MITHVVLFKPRGDVTDADRRAFVEAIVRARREIPGIRRFHLGRRVLRDVSYAEAMPQDFSFAAVIEFDDLAAVRAYLQHPAHDPMGSWFWKVSEASLVYDYEMTDAAGAAELFERATTP
ncbi:MAG: Dabb family protein [Vicinamibacterales bacterium]